MIKNINDEKTRNRDLVEINLYIDLDILDFNFTDYYGRVYRLLKYVILSGEYLDHQ